MVGYNSILSDTTRKMLGGVNYDVSLIIVITFAMTILKKIVKL